MDASRPHHVSTVHDVRDPNRTNHLAYVDIATRRIEGYTLVSTRARNVTAPPTIAS
jgi:hypothetical protein